MCILDGIINKYHKTNPRTIKMKPVDVKPSIYIDFNKENNKQGSKFKVSDHERISKYNNIFAQGYSPIGQKKCLSNTVPWTYVITDITGIEIIETFHEKELEKTNQKELTLENKE